MPTANYCPTCQAELPVGAPAGLCPACLLKAGLTSDHVEAGTRTNRPTFAPPSPAELAPHFPQLEIMELIGQGGMGAVYKVRQVRLDRIVALKVLPKDADQGQEFADRFNREAQAMARLSHPNIIAIHDYGEAGGWFYFVMEYVDGVNMRQAMKADPIPPKDALAIVAQICEALQYAHEENVVHRDIKPENILLTKKGRVKIADFGLAKLLGSSAHDRHLTATQQVMGTIGYMAPEQLEGSKAIDHRADIYALGVVFYELLTGELPMGRFAPPSQKVQIDVRLDEVVLKSLEKEPSRRYQSASQVKHEVERISAGPRPPISSSAMAPLSAVAREALSARLPVVGSLMIILGLCQFAVIVGLMMTSGDRVTVNANPPKVAAIFWATDFIGFGLITACGGLLILLRFAHVLAIVSAFASMISLATIGTLFAHVDVETVRIGNYILFLDLLGIPLGIWALLELNQSAVKARFRWPAAAAVARLRHGTGSTRSASAPSMALLDAQVKSTVGRPLETWGIVVCVLSCLLFWPFYGEPLKALGLDPRFVMMSRDNWIMMLLPSIVTGLALIIAGPLLRRGAILGLVMLLGGIAQLAVTLWIVPDAPNYLNTWFMLILGAAFGLLGAWRLRWLLLSGATVASTAPPDLPLASPSSSRRRWVDWTLALLGVGTAIVVAGWVALSMGWIELPNRLLVQKGEFEAFARTDAGQVDFPIPYENVPNIQLDYGTLAKIRVVRATAFGFEWQRNDDSLLRTDVNWMARGQRETLATRNTRQLLLGTWKEIDGSDQVTFHTDGTFSEKSNTGVSAGTYRWLSGHRIFVHDPNKQPREIWIQIDQEILTIRPENGLAVRFRRLAAN
jgi:hypothetical protein